ncbi:hypothetical protein Hanom_Chr17g01556201 [Helianthus anomalus]
MILRFRVKYTDGPCGLHFVTHLVLSFFQNYMDGPCGLHFVTHLVPNLDMLNVSGSRYHRRLGITEYSRSDM